MRLFKKLGGLSSALLVLLVAGMCLGGLWSASALEWKPPVAPVAVSDAEPPTAADEHGEYPPLWLLMFLPLVFGAVTVTQQVRRNDQVELTIVATADADTTSGNIAHVLGPDPVAILIPILAAARISLWILTTRDGTNLVLLKATTAGSGDAGAQLRIFVERRR